MSRNYEFKKEHKNLKRYSFSKLSTYKHCPYGYYLTYIMKIRGKDSIYGIAGTSAHEASQDIVEGKINNIQAANRFNKELDEAINVLGMKFPTEKSNKTYKECVTDFLLKYNPKYNKYDIEKGFDVLIGGNKTLVYGFIDLIIHNEDNSIDVVDYKTSSDFTKKDFESKKMQLLVYAKALQEDGYKINRLYFNMLKYTRITWTENDKIKSTKAERNAVGDKLKNVAKRMLKKEGLDDTDIDIRINEMIDNNTIDELIADRFTLSDYEVDVELSEENIKEMEEWVDNIISEISKKGTKESNYPSVKIDKSSEFFCNMLCGKDCRYFNEYKNNDNNSYKNRKKKVEDMCDELDDLL